MRALVRFMDWPLRAKMAALLVIATLLPLAITAIIDVREARERLAENAAEVLAARADHIADQLDIFHIDYQRAVNRVAHLPDVIELCSARQEDHDRLKPHVRKLLEVWPASDKGIQSVAVLDLSGTIKVATEDLLIGLNLSYHSYMREALRGRQVISDVNWSETQAGNSPTITYVAPVFGQNQMLIGLAAFWVNDTALQNVLKASNELAGPGSYAVLYDNFGIRIGHTHNDEIIFHPAGKLDPTTITSLVEDKRFGTKTRQLLEDVRAFPEQFERAISHAPNLGVFRGFAPIGQKWNYGIARRFDTAPWTIFYMVPEESLNAKIAQMTQQKTLFALLIIFLALVGGITSAAVILKPIRSLTRATEAIAIGNLGARVQTGFADELGKLGTSFNSMAAQLEVQAAALQQAHDELELRVQERTSELEQATKNLKREISDHNRAKEVSRQLAAIVEHSDDAIIGKDLNGIITSWNQGAEKIFGYTAAEAVGTSITRLIPEDRQGEEKRILKKLTLGESIEPFETRRVTKAGNLIDISLTVSPIKDEDGRIIGASKVARNIGESLQAKRALQISEERLRTIVENLDQGLAVSDLDGQLLHFNRAALEMHGFSSLDECRRHLTEFASIFELATVEGDVWPLEQWPLARILRGEKLNGLEIRIRRLNSDWQRIFSYGGTLVSDPDGRPMIAVVTINDITQRKHAEEALRESNERFQQLAENVNEVFWITNPAKNQMLYVSPAYEKIWGCSCASLYHSPTAWLDAIHPEDREHIRLSATTKQVRGEYDETYRIVRPDGSLRWIRDRAYPLRNSQGEVFRVVGTASDITVSRNLEQQLRQSQKMEAIGQLAGGVAHDFNNLLTVINGRSQLMMRRFKSGEKMRNDLELIYKTGERAASLTRQLLAFSRQQVLEPIVLDLNAITMEMDKMLHRLIPENIDLSTALDPSLNRVKADPGQIEQVIMNLVVNARDAMPNGGTLTIETANVELSEEYCSTRSEVQSGKYVLLAVSDTGHGMDASVKARIFEPFFTTKPQGKGTGLGLSMVFGFVKQSNGHIEVYSEVGKGTTFKIYLPQTQERPAIIASDSQLMPSGREVILIVEDEEGVRELIRDLLELNGYTVLVADNGNEALQIIQSHNGHINLLVTDVVMPGMGGPELVERMKVLCPKTKVLFTSGYTDHAIVRNGALEAGVAFIQKPFTPANLARKIRDVLDRS